MKHWVRNDEKQATKSPRKWWKTLDNRRFRIKLIQLMKSHGCECRAGKDRTINRIQPNAYWNIRFGANHFSSTDAEINLYDGNSIHVCYRTSKLKKKKNEKLSQTSERWNCWNKHVTDIQISTDVDWTASCLVFGHFGMFTFNFSCSIAQCFTSYLSNCVRFDLVASLKYRLILDGKKEITCVHWTTEICQTIWFSEKKINE